MPLLTSAQFLPFFSSVSVGLLVLCTAFERDLGMGTWNGRLVIVDDSMPVEVVPAVPASEGVQAQDSYTKYTTYILGEGAIGAYPQIQRLPS